LKESSLKVRATPLTANPTGRPTAERYSRRTGDSEANTLSRSNFAPPATAPMSCGTSVHAPRPTTVSPRSMAALPRASKTQTYNVTVHRRPAGDRLHLQSAREAVDRRFRPPFGGGGSDSHRRDPPLDEKQRRQIQISPMSPPRPLESLDPLSQSFRSLCSTSSRRTILPLAVRLPNFGLSMSEVGCMQQASRSHFHRLVPNRRTGLCRNSRSPRPATAR